MSSEHIPVRVLTVEYEKIGHILRTKILITTIMTADGERQSYTYLINLILQNKVIFPTLQAIEGHILGGDVLIGMDVITQGDFAVTNKGGKTIYSFRFPSLTHIDFGQEPYSNISEV